MLKGKVTSIPILALPDNSKPFCIEADSSDFATGAVLSQPNSDDNKWHPAAFLSKSLSPVERNYEIHDKEMLAIVRALEEWRHFVLRLMNKRKINCLYSCSVLSKLIYIVRQSSNSSV